MRHRKTLAARTITSVFFNSPKKAPVREKQETQGQRTIGFATAVASDEAGRLVEVDRGCGAVPKGYESSWLAITLWGTKQRYIPERGLRGGDCNLHTVRSGSWQTADRTTLLAENKPDRSDTISHMLLAATNLDKAMILIGEGKRLTRRISFRHGHASLQAVVVKLRGAARSAIAY